MGEIEQVMAMIDAAAGSATSYTESLAGMSEKLSQSKDREGLRAIVESLVHTAKEMEVSNQQLEERLNASKQEITELQENLEVVRNESLTDPLTQLANRKFFDDTLEAAIADARAKNEPLSLMMTDIDHFKNFNDSFGHLTGDQVLRLVATSVKQNVKGQDTAARYGGEEFAVILPNTVLRSAMVVADHIRRAVMTKELMKRSTGEHLGRVTVSIGVATLHKPDSPQSFIERTDCLPLCRQAPRPQPGDVGDRSGSHHRRRRRGAGGLELTPLVPAQAGTQTNIFGCAAVAGFPLARGRWIPACTGMRGERLAYSAASFAGVNCTLSPQPQAEVWFGLLKTNCAESFSVL